MVALECHKSSDPVAQPLGRRARPWSDFQHGVTEVHVAHQVRQDLRLQPLGPFRRGAQVVIFVHPAKVPTPDLTF